MLAALGRGDACGGNGCAGDAQGGDRHRGGVARGGQDGGGLFGRRGFLNRLGHGGCRDRLCRGLHPRLRRRLGIRRRLRIGSRRGLGRKGQIGVEPQGVDPTAVLIGYAIRDLVAALLAVDHQLGVGREVEAARGLEVDDRSRQA